MSDFKTKYYNDILAHHGIKGQKWGVRRYQNEDGTRTEAGKKRERAATIVSPVLTSGVKVIKKKKTDKEAAKEEAERKKELEEAKSPDYELMQARKQAYTYRRMLSDEDLERSIKRLKLEREYKNLAEEDLAVAKKGESFVKETLKTGLKKAVPTIIAGTISYAVRVAITKQINPIEAAAYIAANPNKKK